MDYRFKAGANIEVLYKDEWLSGKVISSKDSPFPEEDFQRITVECDNGYYFEMCHPECVRIKNN